MGCNLVLLIRSLRHKHIVDSQPNLCFHLADTALVVRLENHPALVFKFFLLTLSVATQPRAHL